MVGTIINVHVVDDCTTETIFGKHTLNNLDKEGVITGFYMLVV